MQCPVCDVPLSISSREGIEIDFCPQCRGVWLDRGELDKIIDRASTALVGSGRGGDFDDRRREPRYEDRRRSEDDDRRYEDERRYERRDEDDDRHYGGRRRKKRGGFLEDLFDFD